MSVLMRVTSPQLYQRVCQLLRHTCVRNASSAQFQLSEYKLFKLDTPPAAQTECTRDDAMKYLENLNRIRHLETTLGNMYKEKQIRGFCHLSSGQEAVAVGIESALHQGDTIITSYRCHGFCLMRGMNPNSIITELAGRKSGCSAGKGGSMHLYGKDFYGGNGIVGAQVPLGVGIALRMKHRGESLVSVTLYGDGAANQGQVFESFNLAKLWNLPVIFVCENNKYGMGTAVQRSSASIDYYTRGDYIPGIWVDGMDVLTVREATRFARDWCVSGKGPILLEVDTYRYYGHSMSDPGTSYRTRDEVQSVRRGRDPIKHFEKQIVDAQLCTQEEAKNLDKQIRQEIDSITEKCLADVEPPLEEVFTHIHHRTPEGYWLRGCDIATSSP